MGPCPHKGCLQSGIAEGSAEANESSLDDIRGKRGSTTTSEVVLTRGLEGGTDVSKPGSKELSHSPPGNRRGHMAAVPRAGRAMKSQPQKCHESHTLEPPTQCVTGSAMLCSRFPRNRRARTRPESPRLRLRARRQLCRALWRRVGCWRLSAVQRPAGPPPLFRARGGQEVPSRGSLEVRGRRKRLPLVLPSVSQQSCQGPRRLFPIISPYFLGGGGRTFRTPLS